MTKRTEQSQPSGTEKANSIAGVIGRRDFVRSVGALAAITAYGAACGDDGPTGNEGSGTVRLTITGLQAGATSGGSAIITGPNIAAITLDLPPLGTIESPSIPAGTYHVVYSPPTGYTMAPGNANEFDVTVVRDEVTEVTLVVVQATGTLQITVTGLASGAVNGGSASVLRTDITGQTPLVVPIPVSGSASTSVVPGTYAVTYTAPSGHVLAPGETNPETVTVAAGASATATFDVDVVPATGTLRVTVTGLTAGSANAGAAQLLRTDITGQTPVDVTIPASGTLDSTVAVGTYQVTYFAPSGHTLVAGQTNPQTVNVTASGTATATFQIQQSVQPTGIVFHSDWSTATGVTDAALRDTSKPNPWTLAIGSGWAAGDPAGIVPKGTVPMPSANMFRVVVPFTGTEHGPARIIRYANLPVPTVGNSLYYRWYKSVNLPDPLPAGFDALWHPMQDGQASSGSNWEWEVVGRTVGDAIAAGKWRNRIFLKSRATHRRFFLDLDLGVVYRFELRVLRNGDNEFSVQTKVFVGDSTTPIATEANYMSVDGGGTHLGNVTSPFVNAANLNGLNCGQNDVQSGMLSVNAEVHFGNQAAFAVGTTDWIGPYANGI